LIETPPIEPVAFRDVHPAPVRDADAAPSYSTTAQTSVSPAVVPEGGETVDVLPLDDDAATGAAMPYLR
jgi:hypothetical protein